jgi:tRNA(Ile)-lysidine synthase
MTLRPADVASRLAGRVPPYPHAAVAGALCGGADSAALLHALASVARDEPRLRLRALHVDHGLQAASATLRDAAARLATLCRVPLEVLAVRVDPHAGDGVEAAARASRYAALAGALAPGELLLAAHHREDQAETVLLQLFRGAGLRGLAAMPEIAPLGAGFLVRPLLDVPRASLLQYAAVNGLPWVEDPMNAEPRFDRAFLRAELWPRIVARWPGAAGTIARSARHAAEAQSLVDAMADEDLARLARGEALDVPGLIALPDARRSAALRRWLAVCGTRAPPARRLALVERELLRSRGPNGPRLAWDGVELRRHADQLHLVATLEALSQCGSLALRSELALGALGTLGRLSLVPTQGRGIAAARVALPLAVRPRSGGERLQLVPGTARRPLKDLLREARIPPWVRERLPVLWDGARLVAVVVPGGAWIAAELAAAPEEAGYAVEWRGAPSGFAAAPPRSDA